jgi:hypothetical protein
MHQGNLNNWAAGFALDKWNSYENTFNGNNDNFPFSSGVF